MPMRKNIDGTTGYFEPRGETIAWTIENIVEQKETDDLNSYNSLGWIGDIARSMLYRMNSDEIYEFIIETIEKKQATLIRESLTTAHPLSKFED